jgi:hypothetical protein
LLASIRRALSKAREQSSAKAEKREVGKGGGRRAMRKDGGGHLEAGEATTCFLLLHEMRSTQCHKNIDFVVISPITLEIDFRKQGRKLLY